MGFVPLAPPLESFATLANVQKFYGVLSKINDFDSVVNSNRRNSELAQWIRDKLITYPKIIATLDTLAKDGTGEVSKEKKRTGKKTSKKTSTKTSKKTRKKTTRSKKKKQSTSPIKEQSTILCAEYIQLQKKTMRAKTYNLPKSSTILKADPKHNKKRILLELGHLKCHYKAFPDVFPRFDGIPDTSELISVLDKDSTQAIMFEEVAVNPQFVVKSHSSV